MNSIIYKAILTLRVQLLPCLFLLLLLSSCRRSESIKESSDELLQTANFRLRDTPQEVVHWQYQYVNRPFPLPSYRTPQGDPLPGWGRRVVTTRRFFTDQSARIYFRIRDLRQNRIFSSTIPAAAEAMRIWPVGSILVLETFSGKTDLLENATPTAIDCIRKFRPDLAKFPVNSLFAGEWCYQRFSVEGEVSAMPAGASACHNCHNTAFNLTGDFVFTVYPKDAHNNGSSQ